MFSVAYRWNTANLAAISQIPWTLEELEAIKEQWRWLRYSTSAWWLYFRA